MISSFATSFSWATLPSRPLLLLCLDLPDLGVHGFCHLSLTPLVALFQFGQDSQYFDTSEWYWRAQQRYWRYWFNAECRCRIQKLIKTQKKNQKKGTTEQKKEMHAANGLTESPLGQKDKKEKNSRRGLGRPKSVGRLFMLCFACCFAPVAAADLSAVEMELNSSSDANKLCPSGDGATGRSERAGSWRAMTTSAALPTAGAECSTDVENGAVSRCSRMLTVNDTDTGNMLRESWHGINGYPCRGSYSNSTCGSNGSLSSCVPEGRACSNCLLERLLDLVIQVADGHPAPPLVATTLWGLIVVGFCSGLLVAHWLNRKNRDDLGQKKQAKIRGKRLRHKRRRTAMSGVARKWHHEWGPVACRWAGRRIKAPRLRCRQMAARLRELRIGYRWAPTKPTGNTKDAPDARWQEACALNTVF